jgi:hypothetical protein
MRERFNDLAEQATQGYKVARKSAARGVRSAYNTAQEYPGTIAAVVVGLGITAFLLWAVRRAGGWRNLQDSTVDRVREGYDYVRDRAARLRSEAPQIAE